MQSILTCSFSLNHKTVSVSQWRIPPSFLIWYCQTSRCRYQKVLTPQYKEMYYIKKKKKRVSPLWCSCSGSNYQTVCVYVCKHNYFCCKVLTCESMRSDSLLDISGIIGFHQFHKNKNKKKPTNVWLKCFRDFFFRSEHFSLQDSKVKPSDI